MTGRRAAAKRTLAAVALISATGAAWWLLAAPPGSPPQGPVVDGTMVIRELAQHRAAPARHRVPPAAGRLRVEVTAPSGEPAPGRVLWVTTRRAPAGQHLGHASPEDVSRTEHGGTAALDVPPGAWTWLLAGGLGGRHVLVPPFEGEETVRVTTSLEPTVLHVFVRDHDLVRPAAGTEVRVIRRGPDRTGTLQRARANRTDEAGYVRVEGLDAGPYVVHVAGTDPGRSGPHVQAVVLGSGPGSSDVPVTLVAPPPRRPLRLHLQGAFSDADGPLPPKLFLRPRSTLGLLLPLPVRVEPKAYEVEVMVPPGDYEIGVAPPGRLVLDPARPVVSVGSAGGEAVVRLRDNAATAEVTLEDVPPHLFPLQISARREGDVLTGDEELLFLGPRQWHSATQTVPALPGPVRLVCKSRRSVFVSEDLVRLDRPGVRVSLVRANRLVVTWLEDGRDTDVILETRVAGQVLLAGLPRRLVRRAGTVQPARTTSLVVPRGELTLLAFDADEGTELWRRTVTPDRDRVRVDVRAGD